MINRSPLRTQVLEIIRNWILNGDLRAGSRIEEPALAARIGVSRTPLREALLHLERDGLIRSEQGKGFRVAPLSVEMIREIYPIIGALERLALRLAEPPTREVCAELWNINTELASSQLDAGRQFELDRTWHKLLLQRCPNERLLEMNNDLTVLIRRFDCGDTRGVADVAESCRHHADILSTIEAGDLAGASNKLEAHWVACIEPVETWLRAHIADR